MRDGIVCHYFLFDLHQTIQEVDNGEVKSIGMTTMKNLGRYIGEYCANKKINYVHLYGDNVYAKKIIEDIDKFSGKMYSNNKIEIEVN